MRGNLTREDQAQLHTFLWSFRHKFKPLCYICSSLCGLILVGVIREQRKRSELWQSHLRFWSWPDWRNTTIRNHLQRGFKGRLWIRPCVLMKYEISRNWIRRTIPGCLRFTAQQERCSAILGIYNVKRLTALLSLMIFLTTKISWQ